MTLPPTFTTLYRLFLRTCSASVLHHPRATSNLRALWRPTFEDAVKVVKQLQEFPDNSKKETNKKLIHWLQVWERRSQSMPQWILLFALTFIILVDNTLALMYTSAKSRGLPHQITRNLGLLVLREQRRLDNSKWKAWKPQRPPDSSTYPPHKRPVKGGLQTDLDSSAWAALEQVVKMAEGHNDIFLGKVALKKRRPADKDAALP